MVPDKNDGKKQEKIDIFLVPLLCFNDQLYRVGYGGDYFDRTLEYYS